MNHAEKRDLLREAEPLIEALARAIKTHSKLEEARQAYTGYSFDYFYRNAIDAAQNAAIELACQIKALKS